MKRRKRAQQRPVIQAAPPVAAPLSVAGDDAHRLAVGLAIAAADRDDQARDLLLAGMSRETLVAVAGALAGLAASGTAAAAGGHAAGREALAVFALSLAAE